MFLSHYKTYIFFVILTGVSGNSDPNDGPVAQYDDGDDVPGEPLSAADFKNAENIPSGLSFDSDEIDPIEKAGKFEGDIIITRDDLSSQGTEKNVIIDSKHKWPNAVVPYSISARFNEQERSVIAKAIMEFHRQTCISFKARTNELDYIKITTGNGCSSSVGRMGGIQDVTLGEGCMYTGIVMHELMHSIGFWHEQCRWDRDDNIIVHFENIQPGMEDNFKKVSWKETQNFSAPYDTSSIMHYGPYAFSKNRQKGLKTILPRVSNGRMGQRTNFSEVDVYRINKLYNCKRRLENKNETNTGNEATTQPPNDSNNSTDSENSNKCTDDNKHCQQWASNGECEKNPKWMLENCRKSCKNCSPCADNNKYCEAWAANGECSKNPEYMNVNCAKSCKRC